MTNKKQKATAASSLAATPIKAKPPVDTNKPKFTKSVTQTRYEFTCHDPDYQIALKLEDGEIRMVSDCFYVEDIPTLIAVLQDIYSEANV